MKRNNAILCMKTLCMTFSVIGLIFLGMGFYKKNNYTNSEYSLVTENAYVGGDAYNYIINGTYFTAYAVIGTGALIIATITGVTGVCLSVKQEYADEEVEKLPEI